MRELMATANKVGVEEDLVRHSFAQALPLTIKPVIAAARNLRLAELGTLANEVILFMKMDMVQNTTYPEHYKGQSGWTANPKTETHTAVCQFYENQRPQVYCGTCNPWCQVSK